jgi:hypothetical protein
VPEYLKNLYCHLEGRIGQVYEIYACSPSGKKTDYSVRHNGVCYAMLVDRAVPGDELVNRLLTMVDSDSSSDEE